MNWYHNLNIDKKETLVAYLFLVPSLFFFITFVLIPMGMGIFTSFFDYTSLKFEFNGLGNYIKLFSPNEYFLRALKNTVVLVLVAVPIIVLFSLFAGYVLYYRRPFTRAAFRAIFYLPVVTGSVAVVVFWSWFFNEHNGVLNWVLRDVLQVIERNISWFGDKRYALSTIITVLITTSVGQPIVLYIASLGNLDVSQLEAAKIDGANEWQVFKHVTLPGIMPTTLYVVIITTINTFQCFNLVQLLTNGAPSFHSATVMFLVYEQAFTFKQFGYANAMGIALAIIIGLISMIQYKVFKTDTY
ncbi:MAG: sugar ABC transporter permease [Spirochaetales bacterium]